MLITRVEFCVRGTPEAQPRARGRAMQCYSKKKMTKVWTARVYNPEDADAWKIRVALAARPHLPVDPWVGPVRVDVDAFFDRPERLLKRSSPAGPIPHTARPDRDNLDKAILDTLKRERLFRDDAQVCAGEVRKWYVALGCAPGIRVVAQLLQHEDENAPALPFNPGDPS